MEKKLNKILFAFLAVGASMSMTEQQQTEAALQLSLAENGGEDHAIAASLQTAQEERDFALALLEMQDNEDPDLRRALRLSAAESRIKKPAEEVMRQRRPNRASASASSQARSSHEQVTDPQPKQISELAQEVFESAFNANFRGALHSMRLIVERNDNQEMRTILDETQDLFNRMDPDLIEQIYRNINHFLSHV